MWKALETWLNVGSSRNEGENAGPPTCWPITLFSIEFGFNPFRLAIGVKEGM